MLLRLLWTGGPRLVLADPVGFLLVPVARGPHHHVGLDQPADHPVAGRPPEVRQGIDRARRALFPTQAR
jgi:hypothetical protein